MSLKQKIITTVMSLAFVAMPVFVGSATVQAGEKCGNTDTAIIGGDVCRGVNNGSKKVEDNAIWKLLIFALQIMVVAVGVLAVGGIAYGAIMYASAADSAEQKKKAMEIIRNVVIGLVGFGLMVIILNFLVPGGVFG